MFHEIEKIDLILGFILAFGFVRGIFRGFILELSSVLALLLAGYGAIRYYGFLQQWLAQWFNENEQVVKAGAIVITFLIIALFIGLIGKMLTKILEIATLGLINRFLGGIFGFLKWGIAIGLFFIFAEHFGFFLIPQKIAQNSKLYPMLYEIGNYFYGIFTKFIHY